MLRHPRDKSPSIYQLGSMTNLLRQKEHLHFFAGFDKLIHKFLWDQDIIRSDAGLDAM